MPKTLDTVLSALHQHGLNHHQTAPLRRYGITTVEQLARLVDAHRVPPGSSELAGIPGMGARRIDAACEAVDHWRDERHGLALFTPQQIHTTEEQA